jgi:hypothetical protein
MFNSDKARGLCPASDHHYKQASPATECLTPRAEGVQSIQGRPDIIPRDDCGNQHLVLDERRTDQHATIDQHLAFAGRSLSSGISLGHIYLSLTQHLTPPSRSSMYAVEPLGHVVLSILLTHLPLPTGAPTPVPFFAGAFVAGPGAATAGGMAPESDETVGARVAGVAVCAIAPDE